MSGPAQEASTPDRKSRLLDDIRSPDDMRRLAPEQLPELAAEIRERVISVTAANGGHIGPNLGVVELTLALHRVFETPRDRLVFDVAHQGYIHKLLTGRNGHSFDRIRQTDGLSGFLARNESEHDAYGAGHAGTALSAALGMAIARDRMGGDENVVAILGDAAFTCGITMEALNNVSVSTRRLVMVLNDNEWSIARNVGAIAKYLNEIITNPYYKRINREFKTTLRHLPYGESVLDFWRKWKRETKDFFVNSSLFESYGVRYLGPFDGHDIELLTRIFAFARQSDEPLLIHVLTKKGKGYEIATQDPQKFHGTSPFDRETGLGKKKKSGPPAYQDVFGKALTRYAQADPRLVGITAAMPSGTGLNHLAEACPEQFFDVGIAEEHAVLCAAGMATRGLKPVCAIYSTFLQRAYDPIIHDVALQRLPVVFGLDRAGLSPNDGPTHHGLFDLAYTRCIPHTVIMQPKDEDELCDLLWTALHHPSGPTFLRYPRGVGEGVPIKENPALIPLGEAEELQAGADIAFWALGPWVAEAQALADQLSTELDASIAVVNARFLKPLDHTRLEAHARQCRLLVTFEDGVRTGGFGSAVVEALSDAGVSTPVERIGWPDQFVDHASSVGELRAAHGLDRASLAERLRQRYAALSSAPAGETLLA